MKQNGYPAPPRWLLGQLDTLSGQHQFQGHPGERILEIGAGTVGAYGIPEHWFSQLKPAGRLVVPLRLRGGVSRSIVFERGADGRWASIDSQMCGFMPLRGGIADDPRRIIRLTDDGAVTVQMHQEQPVDQTALVGVLDQPRTEAWTGVTFARLESMEWMYLWLTCSLDEGLSRMPVEESAIGTALLTPMFRWDAMAVVSNNNLAYLARRPGGNSTERGELTGIGVIGHGRTGRDLAHQVAGEIRTWDEGYRHRPYGSKSRMRPTPSTLPPADLPGSTSPFRCGRLEQRLTRSLKHPNYQYRYQYRPNARGTTWRVQLP